MQVENSRKKNMNKLAKVATKITIKPQKVPVARKDVIRSPSSKL